MQVWDLPQLLQGAGAEGRHCQWPGSKIIDDDDDDHDDDEEDDDDDDDDGRTMVVTFHDPELQAGSKRDSWTRGTDRSTDSAFCR